jgi:hypothetical protein
LALLTLAREVYEHVEGAVAVGAGGRGGQSSQIVRITSVALAAGCQTCALKTVGYAAELALARGVYKYIQRVITILTYSIN